MVSALINYKMQVLNGTGPGVRRTVLPLLAGLAAPGANVLDRETSQNLVIRSKSVIKTSSVTIKVMI